MRPSFRIAALLVLLLPAFALPAPSDIDDILAEDGIRQALWGIYVAEVETGRVLYTRNADVPLIPASNEKLLTTAGALDALGSEYRYQTSLHFDGDVDGGTLRGDLIINGSGDPTFGSAELPDSLLRDPDPLRTWARSLAEMGVTRFEGRLIGDDDVFDNVAYAEGWDIDYVTGQSSRSLGVSTGGLAYHDNVIELRIRSGRAGEPPVVQGAPSDYLPIRNEATTSTRRRGWDLDLERAVGTEGLVLRGSLPRSYEGTVAMPVTNPTRFALHTFRRYLERAGIEVDAELVDVDEMEETLTYDDAPPLFVHFSPPMTALLTLLNHESNNFYAEQIFRTFAWGGSAAGGERRLKEILSRAGVSGGSVSIRDGSGLSRKNLISAEAMGELLIYMSGHGEAETFRSSLAEAGQAQTTLRSRLGGLPVRAKTGSLEYVRALSGYATLPDGREVAFAIFANNYTAPSYRVTQTIDRIVQALAST